MPGGGGEFKTIPTDRIGTRRGEIWIFTEATENKGGGAAGVGPACFSERRDRETIR